MDVPDVLRALADGKIVRTGKGFRFRLREDGVYWMGPSNEWRRVPVGSGTGFTPEEWEEATIVEERDIAKYRYGMILGCAASDGERLLLVRLTSEGVPNKFDGTIRYSAEIIVGGAPGAPIVNAPEEQLFKVDLHSDGRRMYSDTEQAVMHIATLRRELGAFEDAALRQLAAQYKHRQTEQG